MWKQLMTTYSSSAILKRSTSRFGEFCRARSNCFDRSHILSAQESDRNESMWDKERRRGEVIDR